MSQDIRVLVGDDDVNDRFFLEWGFREVCPYVRLDFARSGEEVVEYLADSSRPRPSLLIIDSMMPKKDGFSVLAWLRTRKELEQLPVVMLSGLPHEKYDARALGVRAYIRKPHDLEELKALVQGWKQKYLDPIRLEPPKPNEHPEFQLLVADSSGTLRTLLQKSVAEIWPDASLAFFRDSVEVIKYFEENAQSASSLLLMDLGLASLDTLRWLRKRRGLVELPIILWTAAPVQIEETLAREYGVTEYLKKPYTVAELLQSVRELAGRYRINA